MTDAQKITALPNLPTIAPEDIFPIVDSPSVGAATKKVTVANVLFTYNRSASEIAAGISADSIDFRYDHGDVFRYGAVGNKVASEVTAFQNAFNSGHHVFLSRPTSGFLIDSVVTMPDGSSMSAASRDIVITAGGTIGTYAFQATTTTLEKGITLSDFTLETAVAGVNGFLYTECRNITMERFNMRRNSLNVAGSIGINTTDTASNVGTAHNVFQNYDMQHWSDAHFRLDTVGALTFNNRNLIGFGHCFGGGIAVDIIRGATNTVWTNPQNCTIGVQLGADADNNRILGYEENCTTSISFNAATNNTLIMGNWDHSTISGEGVDTTWLTDDFRQIPNFNDGIVEMNPVTGNAFLQTTTGQNASIIGRVSDSSNAPQTIWTMAGNVATPFFRIDSDIELDGALNHDGSTVGFYATTPITQQTGVAVTDAAIHAALVNLGLITA